VNGSIFAMWYLYIIEKGEKLYTGITTDLKNRHAQHGHARLIYREEFVDKNSAAKRERQVKGWRREKKLALGENASVSLP
jgi:putative endonuclease